MLNTFLNNTLNDLDRFFGTPMTPVGFRGMTSPRTNTPAMNVWRDGDDLVAELELPGFKMDDIDVQLTADTLSVKGSRQTTAPEGARIMRSERSATSFERSIRLPIELDVDNADASFDHGVLRITIPVSERAKPRRVSVKTIETKDSASTKRLETQTSN